MKIQVYDVSLKPAPLSKKLTIGQASDQAQTGGADWHRKTIPKEPAARHLSPLGNLIGPGNEFYLNPLGLLGRLNLPATPVGLGPGPAGLGAPVKGAPIAGTSVAGTPAGATNAPRIVATARGSLDSTAKGALGENRGEPWMKALGHVSAGGLAAGSFHLMSVTQDMTQAHVVGQLQTMGMGPVSADAWSSHMFDVMNTQGAHAVLAGVTVGSATVEFLGIVRPSMPMPQRIAIGSVVRGCHRAFCFSSSRTSRTRLTASGSQAHPEARYQFGTAPQSATCTISADGTRLTISRGRDAAERNRGARKVQA